MKSGNDSQLDQSVAGYGAKSARKMFELQYGLGHTFVWGIWLLGCGNDIIVGSPGNNCSSVHGSPGGVKLDHWYFLAATYDSSTQTTTLYVDGRQEGYRTNPINTGPSPFYVGFPPSANAKTNGFHGAIDNVRLYDRLLSPNEIQTLYTSHHAAPTQSAARPVGNSKPPTCTPFHDDFTSSNLSAWTVRTDSKPRERHDLGVSNAIQWYDGTLWSKRNDFQTGTYYVRFRIRNGGVGDFDLRFLSGTSTNDGWSGDPWHFNAYDIGIYPDGSDNHKDRILRTSTTAKNFVVAEVPTTITADTWHTVEVERHADGQILVFLDGTPHLAGTDTSLKRSGYFGIRSWEGLAIDYAGFACGTDGEPGWQDSSTTPNQGIGAGHSDSSGAASQASEATTANMPTPRTNAQWQALFTSGKLMVGCKSPDMRYFEALGGPGLIPFQQCEDPIWSSEDVSMMKQTPSESAGVTLDTQVKTANGVYSILRYGNSLMSGNSGSGVDLVYLQSPDGYDGLVSTIGGVGPISVSVSADSFRLTASKSVYLRGDPNCCPSGGITFTYASTPTGLRLVNRQTRFSQNGYQTQKIASALQARGYNKSEVTQVINQVTALALDGTKTDAQKRTSFDALAQRWGEGVLTVAVGLMPVYNAQQDQWQSFGSWAHNQTAQLPGNSPFQQDPVASTVHLLFDPSPANITQTLGLGGW